MHLKPVCSVTRGCRLIGQVCCACSAIPCQPSWYACVVGAIGPRPGKGSNRRHAFVVSSKSMCAAKGASAVPDCEGGMRLL